MRAGESLVNPNNCDTCKHKQNPDGGWCYMFREEPTDVCRIHTGHRELAQSDFVLVRPYDDQL